MKGHTGLKALAIALVALLVLPPVASLLAQAQATTVTSQATGANTAQLAAQMYIKRIGVFINKTLLIAEKKNITIPENLTGLINESKNLLAQAQQELEAGNVTGAVDLATKAADTFAPVAIYVWTHIPKNERKELTQYSLVRAINARLQALERLTAYISKLNESGVNTKPLVEILDNVNATLQKALRLAEEGNLTAARALLKKADYMLMVEFKVALHNINKKIHQVAACAAAFRGLARALETTTYRLNQTITLIEENKTSQAKAQLSGVDARLASLSRVLERIYQRVSESNPNSTTAQVLAILLNATVEAKDYVNASIASLEQGDANTSIVDITLAIETINDAISRINVTKLPEILHKHVEKLHREAEKARTAIVHGHARVYSAIAFKIDKVKEHLEQLLAKYQNGTVSRQVIVRAFTHAYTMLVRMKHALGHNAPQWLLEKINQTIQWIKQTVPEAGSSHGGPGAGGHGHGPGSGREAGNGSSNGGSQTGGTGEGNGSSGGHGGHGMRP
ncbi:MAG: hypothetical protein F7C33_07190 [Desulfurococcales archaeon]|nr:hypothetical protein [Desulfurococcales archaeon]